MTVHNLIIEAPGRRSRLLRWRDRCLTFLLWSAWSSPVDALTRLAVGPVGPDGGLLWDAFLHDLGYASSGTGFLIVLLYAWGGYDRHRVRSPLVRIAPD